MSTIRDKKWLPPVPAHLLEYVHSLRRAKKQGGPTLSSCKQRSLVSSRASWPVLHITASNWSAPPMLLIKSAKQSSNTPVSPSYSFVTPLEESHLETLGLVKDMVAATPPPLCDGHPQWPFPPPIREPQGPGEHTPPREQTLLPIAWDESPLLLPTRSSSCSSWAAKSFCSHAGLQQDRSLGSHSSAEEAALDTSDALKLLNSPANSGPAAIKAARSRLRRVSHTSSRAENTVPNGGAPGLQAARAKLRKVGLLKRPTSAEDAQEDTTAVILCQARARLRKVLL